MGRRALFTWVLPWLLCTGATVSHATLVNGSFEALDYSQSAFYPTPVGWARDTSRPAGFFEYAPFCDNYYWTSDGDRAAYFYTKAGADHFEGDWLELSQEVALSGPSQVLFDCRVSYSVLSDPSKRFSEAQVLWDGAVVWHQDAVGEYYDQWFSAHGTHTLGLRLYVTQGHPSIWGVSDYVHFDNLRVNSLPPVPEPASCALLACAVGGIGAMLKRRRKQ